MRRRPSFIALTGAAMLLVTAVMWWGCVAFPDQDFLRTGALPVVAVMAVWTSTAVTPTGVLIRTAATMLPLLAGVIALMAWLEAPTDWILDTRWLVLSLTLQCVLVPLYAWRARRTPRGSAVRAAMVALLVLPALVVGSVVATTTLSPYGGGLAIVAGLWLAAALLRVSENRVESTAGSGWLRSVGDR